MNIQLGDAPKDNEMTPESHVRSMPERLNVAPRKLFQIDRVLKRLYQQNALLHASSRNRPNLLRNNEQAIDAIESLQKNYDALFDLVSEIHRMSRMEAE